MNELLQWLKGARIGMEALAILAIAFVLSQIVARQLKRTPLHAQQQLMLKRLSTAVLLGIGVALSLGVLGIEVGVLLGAAGVATVALGFAAQTSVSNLISGTFLMIEQPFVVGDIIEVDGVTGEVLAIDLISVRLRTFDNILARIPNETMLKANVRNVTHFPIRRAEITIGVAYKEDLERVRALLMDIAARNRFALREPEPLVIYKAFGDSSVDMMFAVWAPRQQFLQLRNSLFEDIKRTFDEQGIEIPFPHRTLYAGSATEPLPVRVTETVS
jgi:small-conductance mechanosensitive channel